MSRLLIMIMVLVAGALLQQCLPAWPLFGGIKPPVLAALVVYYVLRRNSREAWTVVVIAALLHDGLEPGTFGPALLAFPVIGVVGQRIRNEVFSDGLVSQLLFGAATGLFATFSALLVYSVSGQRPFLPGLALLRLFGSFWLGMAMLPLISYAINKLEAALPKRRRYGWQ
jgi:rod shape-determining protein MreD